MALATVLRIGKLSLFNTHARFDSGRLPKKLEPKHTTVAITNP
jgi:hypothetical protein